MSIQRLGVSLGALALVVAACGNSADSSTTTTSTTVIAQPSTTLARTTTLPPTTTTATEAPRESATSTIVVVQQDLTALGYFAGTVDGIAGAETEAALKKFQSDVGLESDGAFGPKTDAELAPLLRADADYVMELQETLTDLEFYAGPIDGDYGKGTERAVKLLQESCDLEQTGNLDINTRLCAGGHI